MKMSKIIIGLLGFILFTVSLFFRYPLFFVEQKLDLSVDILESIETALTISLVIAIVLLWVGIITMIKSKGYKLFVGFILCLIAPLGWLIALSLRNKQLSQESHKAVQSRKLLWVNLIILGIILGISLALSVYAMRETRITSEELQSLETTYRWLIQKGGHLGQFKPMGGRLRRSDTFYEFIALTGRDQAARNQVRKENYRTGVINTEFDIRYISLAGTEISDEDLARLKVLKHLRVLDLRDTKISDAGLIYLYDLKGLRFLYLFNTRVSDVGIGKLKEVLPRCKIERKDM